MLHYWPNRMCDQNIDSRTFKACLHGDSQVLHATDIHDIRLWFAVCCGSVQQISCFLKRGWKYCREYFQPLCKDPVAGKLRRRPEVSSWWDAVGGTTCVCVVAWIDSLSDRAIRFQRTMKSWWSQRITVYIISTHISTPTIVTISQLKSTSLSTTSFTAYHRVNTSGFLCVQIRVACNTCESPCKQAFSPLVFIATGW